MEKDTQSPLADQLDEAELKAGHLMRANAEVGQLGRAGTDPTAYVAYIAWLIVKPKMGFKKWADELSLADLVDCRDYFKRATAPLGGDDDTDGGPAPLDS